MRDFVKEWNPLDTIFFKLGQGIGKVKDILSHEEPDVESIIAAETKHLNEENEQLKELQYPKQVEKINKNYICPNMNCQIEISSTLVEQYRIKHCPECGQRIYLNNYRGATGK